MAAVSKAQSDSGRSIASVVPFFGWIRTYDVASNLRFDILAGLTIAAFSIPESMAYANLAGLSPERGLYASMIALFVYLFFGTSKHMSVGTTSALAIMVAGTLGGLSLASDGDYAAAAALTAIFAGGIAVIAGVLKLGFIVNFISESVLVGFSAGAALFIGSSQLPKLFGIESVEGNFFERIWNVVRNIGDTNGWTLALGIACIVGLILLERLFPKIPTSLIVVLVAIAIMYISNLQDRGVAVAGNIPSGLPAPELPTVDAEYLPIILGLAFGCFLLSYVEGVSVAKTFAAREHETVNANKELNANGAINIGAGLFQGFNVGGSMSRSAVNVSAGAKSPFTGGFAALVLAIVLLFLTAPFEKLPETTLAAVVLVAVKGLIDIPGMRRLWNFNKMEFYAAAAAMAGVLFIGMLEGVLIGAGVSLLMVVWRVSQPIVHQLGRIPGTDQFGDRERHPENTPIEGTEIFRIDNTLFYANADGIEATILQAVQAAEEKPKLVLLDLSNTPSLDLAAIDAIEQLSAQLVSAGTDLRIVGATGAVRDTIRKTDSPELLLELDVNEDIDSAIESWKKARSSNKRNYTDTESDSTTVSADKPDNASTSEE